MRAWLKGRPQAQWQSRRFVRAAGAAEQGSIATKESPADTVERVFRDFQGLDAKQRALLWQRLWCCKTGKPDLTVDDVILEALERGDAVTIHDVTKRFVNRVRMRLEKLRVRGVVVREGRGGAHREYTYLLLRPDRAAKALGERGGGLSRATTARSTPHI
jgi:hypothetical protein